MAEVVKSFCIPECGSMIWKPHLNSIKKYLVYRLPEGMNHPGVLNSLSLCSKQSRRNRNYLFPRLGPVQVQEDLMHLAFEVESMKLFKSTSILLALSLVTDLPKALPDPPLHLSMLPRDMRSKSLSVLRYKFASLCGISSNRTLGL